MTDRILCPTCGGDLLKDAHSAADPYTCDVCEHELRDGVHHPPNNGEWHDAVTNPPPFRLNVLGWCPKYSQDRQRRCVRLLMVDSAICWSVEGSIDGYPPTKWRYFPSPP